ncbi:ArpU family phage packaging/lysis transcriptional regulator [Staphylococcus edaphicus]|uniref:Uncharacterized protein n=1 Tax=Staphylococcus edaphicus TaxID=1955013 RepID=A0A2C6WSA5_9STAP|nr:ArpU family phage packaging/lysis transcriptional regulator [Staphylococcus edaphicus]PHK50636.1 hypothetical protein BTJ66_02005 [Staphylococcus edaphicus]
MNSISQLLDDGLNTLSAEESIIIGRRYLVKNNDTDYQIYTEMHLGKTKYYKMKKRAVNKMGIHLNLEFYK